MPTFLPINAKRRRVIAPGAPIAALAVAATAAPLNSAVNPMLIPGTSTRKWTPGMVRRTPR